MIRFFIILSLLLVLTSAEAADFYIDPVNGSMSNDGSQSAPWSTLQGVLDACKVRAGAYKTPWATTVPETILNKCSTGVVTAGDTIYLMSGNQGEVTLNGFLNEDYITVKAYPGQTPTISHLWVIGSSYWRFEGITFSPEFATPFAVYPNGIIEIEKHENVGPNNNITIKNSTIYSVSDNVTSWPTLLDWFNGASRGIVSNGHNCLFEGNTIRNTEGCIAINSSNGVTLRNNTCNYQSGDVFGISDTDDLLIEGNTLKNIIPSSEVYEDTHPDMMQFSSDNKQPSKPMYRITVRRNYVNSLEEYGTHPLVGGNPQGITAFDGMIYNSLIENNIIVVNSPHGTTWTGLIDSKIINNTVVWNPAGLGDYLTSYIRVYDSKVDLETGLSYESYGNVVENNICTSINASDGAITKANNIESVILGDHFINAAAFNYTLVPTSTAINSGATTNAPSVDYYSRRRDIHPDIGAVEYGSSSRLFRNVRVGEVEP